jgi:small ligand-binding sensory domain FIST
MPRFLTGHATHPDWHMALAIAAAQLDAGIAGERTAGTAGMPTLGWVYFSDHYVAHAQALLDELHQRWPGVAWVGASGVGVAASGVEYFDEPALVLMLAWLPRESFRVFSGTRPLGASGGFVPQAIQVHADGTTPDLAALVQELAERSASGYLFGGLASGRARAVQVAEGICEGGLSGVAFGHEVALVSRVTQGCQPIGPVREVTASDGHVISKLDGHSALACLLGDLGVDADEPRRALPALRQTLVGLGDSRADVVGRAGQIGRAHV